MLATVLSSTLHGIDALMVDVEVDVSGGMPGFAMVGLPEGAVRESRYRVRSAMRNSGYDFPSRKITVNLAPADVKKDGAALDLPVALGILAGAGQLKQDRLRRWVALGELSLDGRLKAVRGGMPIAAAVRDQRLQGVILPVDNAAEAAVVEGIDVVPVAHLSEAFDFLRGERAIAPHRVDAAALFEAHASYGVDFAEVRGQEHVKRALEVSAAGGHNVLLVGPPGSGKTMLARRIPSVLPPLSMEESLQTTRVHSVAGLLNGRPLVATRPFRAPHHTVSDAGLIGGGSFPRPGEVSLAHHGVLFLDELPEFRRNVLEVLREPLEERRITIARVRSSVTYPANLMLVAAMNPCKCGHLGDSHRECSCAPQEVHKYRSRISGPLLDRIDIQVEVPAVRYKDLSDRAPGESSAAIRARVEAARRVQLERFGARAGAGAGAGAGNERSHPNAHAHPKIFCNAQMSPRHLHAHCQLDADAEGLLETAMDRLHLSARAYTRILKVARTVADLAGVETIGSAHVSEAIQYRSLDREI